MDSSSPNRESLRVVMFTVIPLFVPMFERVLAEKGHRLVGIVTAPGPRSRRSDDYLQVAQHARPGLDVIVSNYPSRWAGMVRALRPDLICCFGFNWKILAEVLEIPPLGTLNRHDALLPKYRGRNATGWALRNDEPEFGVTAHYMTPEFDNGPILAQRPIPITDDDYSIASIIPRFLETGWAVTAEALDRVVAGDRGTPQDESEATYTGGAFEPEWRYIDWSKPAREIFVQVRCWYGARDVPRGAFATIDGQEVLLTATRLTYQTSNHAAPGTVLERRDDGTLLVQCGDGPLEILEWTDGRA